MDSKHGSTAVQAFTPRRAACAVIVSPQDYPQILQRSELQNSIPIKRKALEHMAVQKLDGNGRWHVIPCDQIAYVFLASRSTLHFIHTEWRSKLYCQNNYVLLRTSRGLTMRTDFRRFSEIQARLDERHFVPLNRAIIANIRRITEVDLGGKDKQVGIAVNNETEWLSASRRAWKLLLPRLGFHTGRDL